MLDRKSIAMNRPPLARAAETDLPHKKAFAAYLRSGNDDALRGLVVEEKALSTAVAADGGYLVDPVTAAQVVGVLRSSASIRTIANVVSVEASAFDVVGAFAFLQNYVGQISNSFLPQAWSLDVEMAFYVLLPVIGTVACVPLRAQAARSGGNSRSNVQSQHSSTSPARQPARRRRIIPLFSGPDVRPARRRRSGAASSGSSPHAGGGAGCTRSRLRDPGSGRPD